MSENRVSYCKEIMITKEELVDWLELLQIKFGKCFDLIEYEELVQIVEEFIKSQELC